MDNKIIEFFEKLYYDNDILGATGINCFNYENGEIDPVEVIKAIQEAGLSIKLESAY